MKSHSALTLHTRDAPGRLRGFQILVSLCVTALLLLSGCASTGVGRMKSSLSGDAPQTSPVTGERQTHQQVTQSRETDDPLNVDNTEGGTANSVGTGASDPDWLPMSPEEILAQADSDEVLADDFGESDDSTAVDTVEGFLENETLDETDDPDSVFGSDLDVERLTLWSRVKLDHANYYSKESLTWLAGGFGVGAIIANTSLDGGIQNHFQISVHSASSDEWLHGLHAQKELGNGRYTLPAYAAAWVAGKLFERVPMAGIAGEWGERSLRATLVGTPPMLAMQYITGASRPGETSSNGMWKPFQDNNGVSGHSFMGAIPFLAAAKMTDKPLLKLAFYAGSTLAPLSRVNDNRHYPSQVFLGWWMAWIATNAVDATQHADQYWSVFPMTWPGATGVGVEYRY